MLLTHAYRELGYELTNQRQDWSAAKSDGVCLALWREQMSEKDGKRFYDLRNYHTPGEAWEGKSGHRKRTAHLVTAMREFDGRVDVVELDGPAGGPYKDAHPWLLEEQNGLGWVVEWFDPRTGYFRVSAELSGLAR